MPISVEDFQTIFSGMPGASGLVTPNAPEFTIVASTEEFAEFAGARMEDFIGSGLFLHFPDNPNAPVSSVSIRESLQRVLDTGQKNELREQRYDIETADGSFREMYWRVVHTPIFNAEGHLTYIIHTAINVTDEILMRNREKRMQSLEQISSIFSQADVAVHLFRGPELVIDIANRNSLDLWNRDASVIGKPLLEVMPELIGTHFPDLLQHILRNREPHVAQEAEVEFVTPEKRETKYLNIVLQPFYENDKPLPVGILGIVTNVTRMVKGRQELVQVQKDLIIAEREKALNVERLRQVIQSAPFPIAVYMGREMRVEMANPSLIAVWGKGPDIIGKTYYEMLPELAGIGVYENLDRVFTDGVPYNAENQKVILKIDGVMTTFYFNYSFTPLANPDGSIYGVMNIAADVTGLNLVRQALEESEERYRILIEESTFAAALYLGPEITIQYANDRMLAFWGKDNSVIGQTMEDGIPELKGQPFIDLLKNVYNTGETYEGFQEKALLDIGNGLEEFYFNFTYKALYDAEGQIYGIHHTALDVTAEVLAKKAVIESERNLSRMIEHTPMAICILWGPEFIMGSVNPVMETLLGRTAQEIEGRPVFEALPEVNNQGLESILNQAIQGQPMTVNEQEFQFKRGDSRETVFVKYIYEPLFDGTGEVEGIIVVASDVTEQVNARRRIEEIVAARTHELAQANNRLQQSNAELEQFAYIASHDLQEPLRKITMFTQLLEQSLGTVSDKARSQMDRINNSVGRMANLIRDILGYSQLTNRTMHYSTIDLNETLEEAQLDFELLLQDKNGRIEVSDLPIIEAVPLQMTQLFANLISNSLKYSKADTPPVIKITSHKTETEILEALKLPKLPKGYVTITFQDNGIGFEQEYAEKIFQIFQRLHGKTQYEGTGIGLAMCRKIAENHNGALFAKGKEGEGSEFIMVLPVKQPPLPK